MCNIGQVLRIIIFCLYCSVLCLKKECYCLIYFIFQFGKTILARSGEDDSFSNIDLLQKN